MGDTFLIKLVISVVVGASWVVLSTVLADKLGSKIGGLVAGLPSTVMFGAFFLAWTQNTDIAVRATTIMPIGAGLSCLFLAIYISLIKKNFFVAIFSGLLIWLAASYLLIRIRFDNIFVSLFSYFFILTSSFYFIEKILKIPSTKGIKIKYSTKIILFRSLVGGIVVGLAVFLGKIGGPIWGGISSMFPAMFISTILVTYFSHGANFSAGTMKSAMVSAVSTVIYALCVRFTYQNMGLMLGTLTSIIISFFSGFILYKFIISKLK